jgi:hypothetical protein
VTVLYATLCGTRSDSTIDLVQDNSIGYTWAKETNGIAVVLEHRYFGQSVVLNATDPTTQQEEFKYLTLDNVIDDAANFLTYLKHNVTGAENSKVIVYSGRHRSLLLATLYG